MLIFETGKMSQAGIEPATYGSHTKQVSANLGPMLYQLSYRDHWFKASPRHFSDCFMCTGRMLPKLHEEVLHSQTRAGHVHNLCARTCFATSDYH